MQNHLPKPGLLSKQFLNLFSVYIILPVLLFLGTVNVKAQTLNAGDIAVIGFNTSFNTSVTAPVGPDEFAIVALASIPSGANIKITDRGWNGSAMITGNTGDGLMTWTTTASIPAGTVFKITVTAGTSPSLTISPSIYGTPVLITGWTSGAALGAMANVGDQVIIYQGDDTNPSNFIYGLNTSSSTATAAGNWQIGSTSARDSDLPPGLTNNIAIDGTLAATAVAFTNNSGGGYFANNFVYTGIKTGSKTALLSAIANRANWVYTTTLTTTYDLNIGGTNFTTSNPVFTLGVLAVNQLNFSGTTTAAGHVLQWQNNGENNLLQYVVETSADGRLFTAAGIVPATGVRNYEFNVPGASQQRHYYRLKMQDRDGSITYSNIILLLGDGNAIQLQVYPNPVTDVLNISGADKILHIVVMDIYGRNVIDANGSGALTQNIGVKHLSEGTYMVTVKTATGNNTFKIVKQ